MPDYNIKTKRQTLEYNKRQMRIAKYTTKIDRLEQQIKKREKIGRKMTTGNSLTVQKYHTTTHNMKSYVGFLKNKIKNNSGY